MDKRGQTTLEYLLLAGGVLILAVVVIYYLNQAANSAGQNIQTGTQSAVNTLTGKATSIANSITGP